MPCKRCGGKEYASGFCKEHFMEYLEKKVRYTIRRFGLFGKRDSIAVAASGGKDSTVLLHMLDKFGYDVTAIMIEPGVAGYTDKNLERLEKFCEEKEIPIRVLRFKEEYGYTVGEMVEILSEKGMPMHPCAVCGVLRRQLLNRAAKDFDALAMGHTMDDEAQVFLMNIFRNDPEQAHRGGPKIGSRPVRVKPLYLIKDAETEAYSRAIGLDVEYGRCPNAKDAYRMRFRKMLDGFEKAQPNVKDNIISFYLEEYNSGRAAEEPHRCKICGGPSSGEVCRACQITSHLKAY